MARLEYEITGNITGLVSAADGVKGILNNLQVQADKLNIQLFGAETEIDIKNIGNSLSQVTGKINTYINAATKGSDAFKTDKVNAIFDALSVKLNIANGNSALFGTTIQSNTSKLRAYQDALNKSIATGLDPFDSRLKSVTTNIESLTTTIKNQKLSDSTSGFAKGLSDGYGVVRKLAYILPGIGIAGIFNLGFEAIGEATAAILDTISALDIFKSKLDIVKQTQLAYNSVLENTNKNSAESEANFKILANAIQDTTRSTKERIDAAETLKNLFPQELSNTSALTLVNGGLKDSIDAITKSIYKQAEAEAFITAIKEEEVKKGALLAKQAEIQAKANTDIADVKAPIQQGATGSSITGVVQAQTISIATQKKGLQDLADFRKSKIQPEIEVINKVIEQLINQSAIDGANLAKKLEGTNNLIKDPLKNFDNIIKASGNKNDFENLKKALQSQLDSLAPSDPQIKTLRDKIQQVEDIIKKAYDVKPTKTAKTSRSGLTDLSFDEQLTNILNSSNASANKSGKVGLDLDLQTIKDKYVKLYADLQNLDDKRDASSNISNIKRVADEANSAQADVTLRKNEAKEISDAIIKNRLQTSQEIQRINDEFGIKSEVTRGRELASINVLYDSEVLKAKGNIDILNTLQQDRLKAIQAVNDKYEKLENDLYLNISLIDKQALAEIAGREESQTEKIQREWEERRKAANKYYDQLKILALSAPDAISGAPTAINNIVKGVNIGLINNKQNTTNKNLTNASNIEVTKLLNKPFTDALQSGIKSFGDSFLSTLENISQQADKSFKAIFSTLAANLINSLNKIFTNTLETLLSKALKDAVDKGLGGSIFNNGKFTTTGLLAAGAGIAGGVVSSITPQTSTVGQGLGGALSGAGTGAVIGSVIPGLGTAAGAVIGGVIGALGGIFGSASARKKQEEQQQALLDQAKQQTAIQRAQLDAYTSNIIGRMTANGVISDISVGATGQLVATISGKDIQFILDRNAKVR